MGVLKIVHLPITDIKTQGLCGCWTGVWQFMLICMVIATVAAFLSKEKESA